ncbi:MAG: hypothetical protein R6X10_17480 [Desulfobacterales bacterium]
MKTESGSRGFFSPSPHTTFLLPISMLPSSPIVETTEVLNFIESKSLMGRGLGYVDIHLLASAIIGNVVLWTFDRRLHEAATELGVSYARR